MRNWLSKARFKYEALVGQLDRLDDAFFETMKIPRQTLLQELTDFKGELFFPFSAGYDKARKLSNPRFDQYPALIACCLTDSDVRIVLALARISPLPLRIRAGGHSGAGYSGVTGGIVIDLSRMDDVSVDASTRTVTVGSGATFAKINEVLEQRQAHIPGGECDNVAVGGYMQGGGYGLTSRTFGMNCDNVVSVRVMLADGTIVVADQSTNHDLWWAVRGGTGNNFGVVLSVTYTIYPLATVYGWRLHWRLTTNEDRRLAADAMVVIQKTFPEAPREFNIQVAFQYRQTDRIGGAEPQLWVFGLYVGTAKDGRAAIEALRRLPGAVFDFDQEGAYSALMESLLDPWPFFPGVEPERLADQTIARYMTLGSTAYWTSAKWQQMLESLVVPLTQQWAYFWLEVYGGAINAYPLEQSAFVHRDILFNACLDVFWNQPQQPGKDPDGRVARSQQFLASWSTRIEPAWDGQIYQNYPEAIPRGPTYAEAYWGRALLALRAAKKKYDPNRLFDFPQAIPDLEPGGVSWPPDVARSLAQPIELEDQPSLWSDRS